MQKLIRSIGVSAAAALLALSCSSCTRRARADRHLKDANKYFAAGEFDRAEIEYKNVRLGDPLNPEAIAQLGIIYFERGSVQMALGYLAKARELQPNNLPARVALAHTFVSSGDMKDARAEASFVLSRNPGDSDAPLILAESVTTSAELKAARAELQKLPQPTGGSAPILVALGTLYFREGDVANAESTIRKALAVDPNLSSANFALGRLLWARKDLTGADKALATAAKVSPLRSPYRLSYAEFKLQTGDVAAANQLLEKITQESPDFVPAWMLRAKIASDQGKADDSLAMLAKVFALDSYNPQAMLLSARLRMIKGEKDKALAELQRMQGIYSKSPPVYYEMGQVYYANGDFTNAITSLNQAVALAPDYAEAILLLADTNLRKGDYKAAAALLEHFLQKHPENTRARVMLAAAYGGEGDFEKSLEVYAKMQQLYPHDPEPFWMSGQILLQQHKRDVARAYFEKALELNPLYVPATEELTNLDVAEKRFDEANARLKADIEKSPKSSEFLVFQAKVFLAQKDFASAEKALEKAIALAPDAAAPHLMLADLYTSTNRQDLALAELLKVSARNPRNTMALLAIGSIYDLQKNNVAARDTYEKLLAIDPNSARALNNLAYQYSENFGEIDKAFDEAQKARALEPNDPSIEDTLGWILYKKHEYQWALGLLQGSAGALSDQAEVEFHLGMDCYMMGMEEPARQALQLALKLNDKFAGADEAKRRLSILAIDRNAPAPARAALEQAIVVQKDDPIVLVRLAVIYEQDGAIDKAIAADNAALQSNPANIETLLNLIRLYSGAKQPEKALELAKSARKLAPDNLQVTHVLGRLAFDTADYPWSLSLLQETARAQPNNPGVQFDLARAAYSVGKISEAEDAMHQSQQAGASGAQAQEAARFLDFVGLERTPKDALAAKARTEDALKSDGSYVPALMVLAEISEQQKKAPEAAGIYEKVLAKYPDFSEAQRRLAIIDAEDPQNDTKTIELATKARQAFPEDAELAKAFGLVLYRQKDFERAASLLRDSAGKRDTDSEVFYYLGMAEDGLDQRTKSKKDLQHALDLHLEPQLAATARKILSGGK